MGLEHIKLLVFRAYMKLIITLVSLGIKFYEFRRKSWIAQGKAEV